jgi:hypothetical protein
VVADASLATVGAVPAFSTVMTGELSSGLV